MNTITRLNLTSSYGALSAAVHMYEHPHFNADLVNDKQLEAMKDLVESGDLNLKDLRSKYRAKKGKPTTLSDDEILFLCAGLDDDYGDDEIIEIMDTRITDDGDADDETDEEKETKEEQEKGFTIDRNTAVALERSAKTFAKQLDDGFVDTMLDVQIASEKTARGIAIMLCSRMYGEHKWGDNTWAQVPDPRITPKEAKEMQGKSSTLLPRWTYKDGARSRVGDWFETAIIHTKEGARLRKIIDDINAANTDVKKTEDQQKYANMDVTERNRLLSHMEKRLDNLVNRFKRMVKLYLVMKEINAYHKTVKAELIRVVDKDGEPTDELTSTLECLVVWKVRAKDGHPIKNESFLPNTFLRLDVKKVDKAVAEKDGYFEALLQTKDREPKDKKGYDVPSTAEAFISFENTIQEFFQNETSLMMFTKKWAGTVDEKEKLEIAETLEEVYMKQGAFFNVTRRWLEDYRKAAEEKGKDKSKAA